MAYRIRKKADNATDSADLPMGTPPPKPLPVSPRANARSTWAFGGAIAVVLLTGIGILAHIHSNKTKSEAKAAAIETQAEQLYSQGERNNGPELSQARTLLEQVMSTYKNTSSSRIAPLFLASISNIQNPKDPNKAMAWLHQGLDRNSGNLKILPFYYESMGVTLMSSAQYDQALAMFQKVVAFPDKILADAALYNIGKIYQDLNQPALAIINYKKLISEFPSSPWAAESEPFLMKNGITPPTAPMPMPIRPN